MPSNLRAHLSEPRFKTYLSACGDDEDKALDLYLANMRLSGAAMESIHVFEVAMRNSIDAKLRAWNLTVTGSEEWSSTPAPLLQAIFRDDDKLAKARSDARKALRNSREPNHDDVVAQLSLGTWRYLMPSFRNYAKQKLWDDALSDAFPRRGQLPEKTFVEWVSMVYDVRNRVAHFEPIFSSDLRGKRRAIKDVLNSIDGDVRKWYLEHDRFLPEISKFYTEWPEFDK